jgi:hypothetical protein
VLEIGNNAFSDNEEIKQVIVLGKSKRFNSRWKKIGFPKKLKRIF